MPETKTNAMRLFDAAHLRYTAHSYGDGKEFCDGVTVAAHLGVAPEQVFKTLVTQGHSKQYYVFVVPANGELDLKKAARAIKEKSVEMIHVKDLRAITGYVRGGCSPFGMKKHFPTIFDETAVLFPTIFVSAGVLGSQIEAAPDDMLALAEASYADIIQ